MDNNSWQLFNKGYGNYGYGNDCHDYDYHYGSGYGSITIDNEKKYTASGSGGESNCPQWYITAYGHHYPNKSDGCGDGEGYGESWSHGSGYGNGRSSDYYAAGYGVINKDDLCEDGHGDGGLYESEYIPDEILYYHTYSDFNAYGGQ